VSIDFVALLCSPLVVLLVDLVRPRRIPDTSE